MERNKDLSQQPNEQSQIPEELIKYWQNQAEIVLSRYTRNFNEFTRGCRGLVQRGDNEIRRFNATGYNIILSPEDAPFTSNEKLIFYNNYIGRPGHFGLVLAEMEHKRIITPEQINFGVKASKALYDEWGINPLDEYISGIRRKDISNIKRVATGDKEEPEPIEDAVSRTVEIIIIFKPQSKSENGLSDDDNAAQIINFLLERCDNRSPNAIPESWDIPDIRATRSLSEVFETIEELVVVQLNIYRQKGGAAQLIVGRQKTNYGERRKDWFTDQSFMNEELQVYLASPAFGIAP